MCETNKENPEERFKVGVNVQTHQAKWGEGHRSPVTKHAGSSRFSGNTIGKLSLGPRCRDHHNLPG